MKFLDLLIGQTIEVMTDARVPVHLVVKTVKENHHSRDLEPATSANDWWPRSEDWTTIDVTFENGFSKSFNNISQIEIVVKDGEKSN